MVSRDRGGLSRRGKLLLAVLAPLLFLGLTELILRAVGFRYEGPVSPLEDRVRQELERAEVYRKDPDLLWTLHPSTRIDSPWTGFRGVKTNALGLRGPELTGPKAPGEVRVLCLGDSVTFGLGLEDEDTWPARMKTALERAPGLEHRKVTVINGAVPGWSSVQGLRLLQKLSALEPDLVVFWFGINDASPARGVPDSEFQPDAGSSQLLDALRGLRVYQLIGKVVDGLRSEPDSCVRVSSEEFRGAVQHLLEWESAGGPATIFIRGPELLDITAGQLERVVARAGDEGVELVVGPSRLLLWVVPAPPGCDLTGRRTRWQGADAILFQGDPGEPTYREADTTRQRAELALDARYLRTLKRTLDAHLEGLPDDSLDYADLLGDALPDLALDDNCHLSALGARLVGQAIADRVLRILEK